MFLYNLTLQRATAITQAITGNFSGQKKLEIVVSKGKIIELLAPDDVSGKLHSVVSVEIFGVIRALIPFRLTGGTKDYIIVGSDSGRIVILEYNSTRNTFDKVHMETFGKSACRRIVPGQYLATDPRGRAVMIGAIEKQKLVYVLNRDSAARLTISSPLEASKTHTIVFSMVGVDVNFDNPIFACLELDYEESSENEGAKQKTLTYYELDLGLNHVVRKWNDVVAPSSNLLISVPGGSDGPSGVLVCSEDYITYRSQGMPERRAAIPKREGCTKPIIIVSHATHKQKDMFFFLVQSELGDLYKVTLQFTTDAVNEINIAYFDTVPVANSICVLKSGFLFVASEFGNHTFYQFQSLGPVDGEGQEPTFRPRPLQHLLLVDELESLAPILDFKVQDLAREESAQLYALCGKGPRSSLRILRHGLTVAEMAVSPLPNPTAVWTVKGKLKDDFDKYIVVSFLNSTLVLAVGETVEEVQDSGFLTSINTLVSCNIGEDAILQVHPNGIRHIRADKRVNEWKSPHKKQIVHAAANELQVAVAVAGGELYYFEIDSIGNLTEITKKDLGREILCLDIAPISKGRQRGSFLAVGDAENTVRMLSLSPDDVLQQVALQALPTQPESLAIIEMHSGATVVNEGQPGLGTLFLNVGLRNGVLMRAVIDSVTGELTDTRTRFLGIRPVKLFKIMVRGSPAVLALSSRTWLCYNYQGGRFFQTPLSYVPLEYAANFVSEQCPEGIVSVAGSSLRIFAIERLGELFNQKEVALRYTPRKFVVHPLTNFLITIETDHNAVPEREKTTPEQTEAPLDERTYGAALGGKGKWASCLRLYDVIENKSWDVLELEENEAALCLCTCVFHERGDEVFIVVGTAKDMTLRPRAAAQGFIHVYRLEGSVKFQLVHKTAIDEIPSALCAFQGRLLVGVGHVLRIYDLGKKKLLRKCENKNFPNQISGIHTQGDRIVVADVQESFHFVKYKRAENNLYVFADDICPRFVTASVMLDYDTLAGADKFGNIFITRLPDKVNEDIEDDPTGSRIKWESGWLNGAPYKLEPLIHFHVGETINSLTRTSMVPGASEVLLYTTLMGSMGALIPFVSREDVDFFSHLEMHLRQENPPLCGRDHLSYRSYYYPVKNVIDGDLCEQFTTLDEAKQRMIAQELDRTPSEVAKKLEDMRNNRLI